MLQLQVTQLCFFIFDKQTNFVISHFIFISFFTCHELFSEFPEMCQFSEAVYTSHVIALLLHGSLGLLLNGPFLQNR